ncbi:MAG: transglutaminase N-terminal domain-containing protein, partial [Actinomycetota bacterium]
MRLRIVHVTSFAYDSPIVEAHTELRLRPLDRAGQHCTAFRVETDPPGIRLRSHQDPLGNHVHHFELLEQHDGLAVTAVSEVHTPPAFVDGRVPPTLLELYDYSAPTEYVRFSDEVLAFAEA